MKMTSKPRPYRVRWQEIECPICKTKVSLTGEQRASLRRKTCGRRECTLAFRRQQTTPAELAARLAAAGGARRKAHAESALAGPYESNVCAKDWSLLAPDGTSHRFRNLSLWLRQHADLFDPDDLVCMLGRPICRAQSSLGKLRLDRKNPKPSWKGWAWLPCGIA
jgi:hypothetical protein